MNLDDWNDQIIGIVRTPKTEGGGCGTRIIAWMVILGIVMFAIITYFPGMFDDRYANNMQSIKMVNPSGTNPETDLVYSEVNQGNAEANLTNSRAFQRQALMWTIIIVVFGLLGIVMYILKRALSQQD